MMRHPQSMPSGPLPQTSPAMPRPTVVIRPGLDARALGGGQPKRTRSPRLRLRAVSVMMCAVLAFLAVAGQLVRLASLGQGQEQASISRPLATAFARPDIVDRNGRLIATDVVMPSLFADPSAVLDAGEIADALPELIPDLDRDKIRADLADRSKRFVWLKRGISPATAEAVHELGLPGLAFQSELKRAYPAGALAGHAIGFVNVDNRGLAGLERYLDANDLVTPVHAPQLSKRKPLRLSLDLGVQHALEDELADAMSRYRSEAAAGVVMAVGTGEVIAAASLPGVDPLAPLEAQDPARADRLMAGAFELGSVFKALTVAMALEHAGVAPDTPIDVTRPLVANGHTIADPHPSSRPLTVSEIFTKSSNVGAGVLALASGSAVQRALFERVGFGSALTLETGATAEPRWSRDMKAIEAVTMSYGHGIAVSPMQFAAAVLPLVNGGIAVRPTFLRVPAQTADGSTENAEVERVVTAETSQAIREMMRANVASRAGTGWRADVPGYRVGGKTGTAEIPVDGRYDPDSVISSFVAAFPMDAPRYLTLVVLFKPQPVPEAGGEIAASRNAAPVTGRLVKRIAPLLSVDARLD